MSVIDFYESFSAATTTFDPPNTRTSGALGGFEQVEVVWRELWGSP